MRIGIKSNHWKDANSNPAGGCTYGTGFTISWQNGPLGTGADRKEPNGAFVEDVIVAALDRLNFYQDSKFNCKENADAIIALNEALQRLNDRTSKRTIRQVEGTHAV